MSQVRAGLQSCDQGQLMLDVLSLAELRRLEVPPTDDSLKYRYRLQGDTYGTVHRVHGPVPVPQGQLSRLCPLPVFPECRARVLALYDGQGLVPEVREGQRCGVVLDQSSFYAEQGGQSHDQGYFTKEGLPVRRGQGTGGTGTCSSGDVTPVCVLSGRPLPCGGCGPGRGVRGPPGDRNGPPEDRRSGPASPGPGTNQLPVWRRRVDMRGHVETRT